MDLKVKSHTLSKYFISKIALNIPHNILAVLVDSADTLSFFHLASEPTPIFQGMSKPSGKKNCLAWSNDGTHLALGSNNLQLWKFDGKKMVPLKNYSEDFLDVKIVAWSPDSLSVAYGGLSIKNAIKIKNIQSGSTKDLPITHAVCSISFDPFGKYLLLLLRNNFVSVYNSTNLSKVREIQLGINTNPKQTINTVKEIRNMGWSPDFSYLVSPSLDDSKVSLALNFSRANGFKLKQAFLGHVSSISCAQFNPNLYEFQGEVTSILALGDSHGVVSLWRVGKNVYHEPLMLANSNNDYHEIVDELQWQKDGCDLIVNVMKRYINILTFDKNSFGREITENEKSRIIEENYGVRSAAQISQKKLEVFSLASLNSNQQAAAFEAQPEKSNVQNFQNPSFQNSFSQQPQSKPNPQTLPPPQQPFTTPNQSEYVKLNEQVTTKDKNNRKRIQPAMLVRKDELPKAPNMTNTNTISTLPLPLSSTHLYSTIGSHQPLKLRPIHQDKQLIKVNRKSYLEIRRIQGYSIVKLYEQGDGQRSVVGERVFTGTIDWVKIVGDKLYFINLGNLYIFGLSLNLLDLPYNIGDVHKIVINLHGDIYYINLKGLIKGFNHINKACYTPIPVTLQSLIQGVKWKSAQKLASQDKDEYERVVEDCWVENNHNLYVNLHQSKNRYYYCRNTQCWVTLELNSGLLKPGDSLRIGQHEQKLCSNFFQTLTNKFLPEAPSPAQTPLQQFETNMIYYRQHNPNRDQYIQNLINLLRQLKMRNNTDRLRSEIVKYFVNKESGCFERDVEVRKRIRQIGGSVIEEFVLFGQL